MLVAEAAAVYCSSQATWGVCCAVLSSVIRANVERVTASARSVNVDAGV